MLASSTVRYSYLHSFNVKSKMFLSVACSVTALTLSSFYPLCLLFLLTLTYAFLMKRYRILAVSYFFMILMMALSYMCISVIAVYIPQVKESAQLSMMSVPFLRGACVMNAVLPLTLTIRVQHLLTTLSNMRLPFVIYLPGAVMIRFVPAFIKDIKQIFEAMKIRGFEFTLKNILRHPVLLIRMSFSPLVFMSLRSSEDLGIACELKGIGNNRQVNMKKQSLHTRDYALMSIVLVTCLCCALMQYELTGAFVKMGGHP
ncbi:MAG: energy-coupling factor transporter transmembrane component T family protein [Succinivibrio sp.]